MKVIIFILLVLVQLSGMAQSFNVNLSAKHQQKLSSIESGRKRIIKFNKFYKKDSARHFKQQDRKFKKEVDSVWKAQRREKKLIRNLEKRGIVPPKKLSPQDTLKVQFQYWHTIMKDTSLSDSVRSIAQEKTKLLALEQARQYPGYQHLEQRYQLYGDSIDWEDLSKQVPGIDTLKGVFNATPTQLFERSSKLAEQRLVNLSGMGGGSAGGKLAAMEDIKNMPDKYKEEYGAYMDGDKLKEEGKAEVIEQATDHFAKYAKSLNGAQGKVGKLLAKYRSFSNSADLKDAKKHSSMEGTTFFERLVVGGNFNVVSIKPVSIDLSPELGYKFSSRFYLGTGMNYRYTFGDSIENSWYVSPRNTGFKFFSSYEMIKNFYGYVEWSLTGVTRQNGDKGQKEWINNYFVGIGRRFLIHPKLYMTATAVYNLNGENRNPVYLHRFQIKIGFQLSELATRKKKIYYDPNR